MRWNHRPNLRLGDRRVVTKFLWWPKRIDNQTRWLECATYAQTVHECRDSLRGVDVFYYGWKDTEWVDKSYTIS